MCKVKLSTAPTCEIQFSKRQMKGKCLIVGDSGCNNPSTRVLFVPCKSISFLRNCPTLKIKQNSNEIVPPWKSNKFPMKLSHLENQTNFRWNCPTLKIKQKSNEIVPHGKSNKNPMKLSHLENQTKIQCEGHWVIVSKIKILSTPVPFVPWQSGMLLTPIPFVPWLWWQSGLTFLKYNLTLKIQG